MFKDSKNDRDLLARFVCALESLADRSRDDLLSKCDLLKMEERIMTAIEDFSAKVDVAFDKIGTSVDAIVVDVDWLKAKIAELQSTPGPISATDQAILDSLEAKVNGMVTKIDALDAATASAPTP